MKVEVPYVVTKPSDDGTFELGDHIRRMDDGSVMCREAGGWVSPDEMPAAAIGMECKVDVAQIKAIIKKLRKDADKWEKLEAILTGDAK